MKDYEIEVNLVDAFVLDGKGGNGAGVVLSGDKLSRQAKMDVAAEVGLSETVFVGTSDSADFALGYFTPVEEVDLCGHATIATFALMHQQGLAAGRYTIATRAGMLAVEVEADGRVWMQQCCPTFYETYPAADFAAALPGVTQLEGMPIQAVSTGLKDILLPMESVEALDALAPDFGEMASLNTRQGVVGIHAFALTGGDRPVAVCRNFAPRYGIDEESATGTSNCALACYLHRYYRELENYCFHQGLTMGKASAIEVRLEVEEDKVQQVFVGGRGMAVGKRVLHVPFLKKI